MYSTLNKSLHIHLIILLVYFFDKQRNVKHDSNKGGQNQTPVSTSFDEKQTALKQIFSKKNWYMRGLDEKYTQERTKRKHIAEERITWFTFLSTLVQRISAHRMEGYVRNIIPFQSLGLTRVFHINVNPGNLCERSDLFIFFFFDTFVSLF